MLLACPRCNAIWGIKEIDEQYCGSCGYPDPDEDDFQRMDFSDYYDWDIETDAEENCFSDADPGL